jgi:arsenate reductase
MTAGPQGWVESYGLRIQTHPWCSATAVARAVPSVGGDLHHTWRPCRGMQGFHENDHMVLKQVLFVCIGNSCRSPMAEGFANYYGRGWLTALSVGSHPAGFLMPNTIKVMQEKGIDISSQSSKGLAAVDLERTDWIVIMESSLAGFIDPLSPRTGLLNWFLPDPVGESIEFYREVRDQIEMRVLDFLEKIRRSG